MKLLLVTGLCLLLFFVSIIESGQLNKREKSEECLALIAANSLCFRAVHEEDAELLCKMQEDCLEFMEPYITLCAGNETTIMEKQRIVNELLQQCDDAKELENGAMITGAGVVIPTLLVAMAAALN